MPYEAKPPSGGGAVANLSATEIAFGNPAGDGLESSADLTFSDAANTLSVEKGSNFVNGVQVRDTATRVVGLATSSAATGAVLAGGIVWATGTGGNLTILASDTSGSILRLVYRSLGAYTTALDITAVAGLGTMNILPAGGTLALGCGIRHLITTKTGAYTVLISDHIIAADATGGAFDITLPSAVGITGQTFIVKRTGALNTVTVKSLGGTLDGALAATGVALDAQYKMRQFTSDGTNWLITGAHL